MSTVQPSSAEKLKATIEAVIAKNQPLRRRASARTTIREDYHRQPVLSYAEAALVAGVTVSTIQNWVGSKKRKVRLPVCCRRGPFRIDRLILERFLRKEAV